MLVHFHCTSTNQNEGSFPSVWKNHRIVEMGRNIWIHLDQPPLRHGHTEQGTQAHVQTALKNSKEETPQHLGRLYQCSHPRHTEFFLDLQRQSPVLKFVPAALLSWHWAPVNTAWL